MKKQLLAFALLLFLAMLTMAQKPVANFFFLGSFQGNNILCFGDNCVQFWDSSTNNPTSWKWNFPGGTPSSSTEEFPYSTCYDSAGSYNVTLIASNASGSDTITKANYIIVSNATTPPIPTITGFIGSHDDDTLFCSTDSSYISYQWYMEDSVIEGATDSVLVINHMDIYFVRVCNTAGCCEVVGIAFPLAVQEIKQENFISLSPNPATNQLTIQTSFHNEAATVSIINLLGQEASPPAPLQRRGESMVVDVGNLPSGIYFIQLTTEKERWVGKFVKE